MCPNRFTPECPEASPKKLARVLFVIAVMTDLMGNTSEGCGQSASLPSNFVYLRDIEPSILQDVRYATANNFTGKEVPGYGAAECILMRPVAEALKRVQTDLSRQDCR